MLLPAPISVWEYLKGAAGDGTLLQASIVTMRRLLAGYMIGIAAGLPLGLLTARFKLCEDTLGVLALGRSRTCSSTPVGPTFFPQYRSPRKSSRNVPNRPLPEASAMTGAWPRWISLL